MGVRESCDLIRAEEVREGDRVHFEVPRYHYMVETIEQVGGDMVRFRHSDDTGSVCFWKGELLYVERDQ